MATYWWLGPGNWADPTKWSVIGSGGIPQIPGQPVPGIADTAYFDVNSNSCTVTANTVVGVLDIVDWAVVAGVPAKTISLGGAFSLTIKSGGGVTLDQIFFVSVCYPAAFATLILDGTFDCYGGSSLGAKCKIRATASAIITGGINTSYVGSDLTIDAGANVATLSFTGANLYNSEKIDVWYPNAVGGAGLTYNCTGLVALVSDPPSSGDIINIYGADNIYEFWTLHAVHGNFIIGAGGVSGLIRIVDGNVGGTGNIGTLTIDDPLTITFTNTGIIGTLNVTTCAAPHTFDFNSMKISTAITINGNNNLTVTGLITYSGTKAGCNLTNLTVRDSDASSGNPIWAQDPSVING